MNQVEFEQKMSAEKEHHNQPYRSVSRAAIACMVFAILSLLLSFVSELFVLFPLLGTCFGFAAMFNLKRYPNELVGGMLAKIGLGLSLLCFVGSVGYHTYIYMTEVPENHTRISFRDLQPPKKRAKYPYSEKALELDGQKVFLKGYVRPSDKKSNLKKFILVGDFGDCCFGGNPEITEIVAISIVTDDTVDYSLRRRKIAGEFRLHKDKQRVDEKDIPSIYYEIIADHVQ